MKLYKSGWKKIKEDTMENHPKFVGWNKYC